MGQAHGQDLPLPHQVKMGVGIKMKVGKWAFQTYKEQSEETSRVSEKDRRATKGRLSELHFGRLATLCCL